MKCKKVIAIITIILCCLLIRQYLSYCDSRVTCEKTKIITEIQNNELDIAQILSLCISNDIEPYDLEKTISNTLNINNIRVMYVVPYKCISIKSNRQLPLWGSAECVYISSHKIEEFEKSITVNSISALDNIYIYDVTVFWD